MKSRKNDLKENPMINAKGVKKVKKGINNSVEDEADIKTLLIILLVIVIVILGIYFLTNKIRKEDTKPQDDVTAGKINYDITNVGTILNRPYKEYYVLVYNSKDDNAVKYSALLSSYMLKNSEKDYIKIYYCDLDNVLNKPYYNVGNDNKSNPKAKNVSELDFGDITLLKIKDGKITNYIEDYTTIQSKLK